MQNNPLHLHRPAPAPHDDPPAFVTAAQIAADTHLSVRYIYSLVDSGTLPCVRFGSRRRIPRADYEAWRDAQIADAKAAQAHRRGAAWQALSSTEKVSGE